MAAGTSTSAPMRRAASAQTRLFIACFSPLLDFIPSAPSGRRRPIVTRSGERSKVRYLGRIKLAPFPGLEPPEREARVDTSMQAPYGMADRLQHPLDLAVPALVKRQLDLCWCQARDASRRRQTVLQLDTFGQGSKGCAVQ